MAISLKNHDDRIKVLENKISSGSGIITGVRWTDTTRTKHSESNSQRVSELVDGGLLTAAAYGEGPNYTQQLLRKLEIQINGVWQVVNYTRKTNQ